MRKFIIWFILCLLMIIAGKSAGFQHDNFISGVIFAIIAWAPALILDDFMKR